MPLKGSVIKDLYPRMGMRQMSDNDILFDAERTKDVRTIIIKIADRLNNMRTLGAMREEKQKKISNQTLELYAPVARYIGLNKMATELEELCLFYLNKEIHTIEMIDNSHISGAYNCSGVVVFKDGEPSKADSRLYRLDEYHTYALPSGERFSAKILGTAPNGALRLEDTEGKTKDYLFKEIEFVIF